MLIRGSITTTSLGEKTFERFLRFCECTVLSVAVAIEGLPAARLSYHSSLIAGVLCPYISLYAAGSAKEM